MDHFLACSGKLIQFSVKESDKTKNISIEAKIWSLTDDECEWENESDVNLELTETKTTVSVTILQTRRSLEIATGFVLPVVVVHISCRDDPANSHLFLVGFNLSTRSYIPLQSIEQFDVRTVWSDRCVSLTALDGPVISWIKDGIHVMCVPKQDHSCHQKPTALPLDFKPTSILGSCYSSGKYVFIVSQEGKHAEAYCVSDATLVCENLPIKYFYPEEFTNIVKINVVGVKICSSNAADAVTHPRIQSTLYAVTDEGYLLYFKDGQLSYAIPISEEIQFSTDIELHVFRPYGLSKILAVVRTNDTVLLLDTTERQVINTWTGVHSCHCGDFVGLGCPQLMILKEAFNSSRGWLITDTFSVLIDRLGGDGPHPDMVQDDQNSTGAAIQALKTRLTSDLVSLGEKRREITCKDNFISRTWKILQDNLQGRPLCHTSKHPSMITLLNKRESQTTAGKAPQVDNEQKPATITEIWQRVVDGHWVVGVECISRNTMSFQVVLIPKKDDLPFIGSITCSSNQLGNGTKCLGKKQRSEETSDETPKVYDSQKKRQKLSTSFLEEELSPLTKHGPACIASLPKFGRVKKVCCHVLLQWTEESVSGEPLSGSQDCGNICLSVYDILQDKYNLRRETTTTIETSRDLVALSLIQLEVRLKLAGTHTFPPEYLKAWLQERAGFTYRPAYRCYMTDMTPLHLVRVEVIDSVSRDQQPARFTLSARDTEQVSITLHHLYSCFPDNVLILPDNDEVISKSLKVAAGNLEKELKYITSAMKDFNKGKHPSIQEVHVEKEDSTNRHVDVETVRANFAKRKRDLLYSGTEMASMEDMELFTKQLETLELNTDLSIIDLVSL